MQVDENIWNGNMFSYQMKRFGKDVRGRVMGVQVLMWTKKKRKKHIYL